ncbi:hypothetical protein [Pseudonocardia lacus]|uniref:hypothetical protein n=1 Tax=Pseudonocardia lacus TaxID=2835865 RepID=UPI001BDD098D|nr:hypothetical protein [Pseudonocardia lacus]
MVRFAVAIIAMEIAALAVGYLAFDAAALLVGAPIIMATLLVLLVLRAAEIPRRRLAAQRASRWDPDAALPGGLMSGFFEAPGARADRGTSTR